MKKGVSGIRGIVDGDDTIIGVESELRKRAGSSTIGRGKGTEVLWVVVWRVTRRIERNEYGGEPLGEIKVCDGWKGRLSTHVSRTR